MVRRIWRVVSGMAVVLALLLAGPLWMLASGEVDRDGHWSSASRAPVGLAPPPAEASEAVVQLYAARAYPAPSTYRAWPGPNSNTFIAWLIREVDGLEATLPVTAVGKDYLLEGPLAEAPGGLGVTASLVGLLGVTLGRDEGLELNLLGLSLGIDPRRPALKLPGIGRLGMAPAVKGRGEG